MWCFPKGYEKSINEICIMRMIRSAVSILLGLLVWEVVGPLMRTSITFHDPLPYLILYVVISYVAGYVTALAAGRTEIAHAAVLASVVLLSEFMYGALSPFNAELVWFAAPWLALNALGTIAGGYQRVWQKAKRLKRGTTQ
jgi:hypothetical protein